MPTRRRTRAAAEGEKRRMRFFLGILLLGMLFAGYLVNVGMKGSVEEMVKFIRTRIAKSGEKIDLFYAEAKMRPDGSYHIAPRTSPARPSGKDR